MAERTLRRIGVDVMGSESSAVDLLPGLVDAARALSADIRLVLLATQEVLNQQASAALPINVESVVTGDPITMEDSPLHAVRAKKNSSMISGIRLLKEGGLDALVSLGNTGALIAAATLMLPKFPAVERPALLAVLPTRSGQVTVIDVGGYTSTTAEQLVQLAQMGVAYQLSMGLTAQPRVALLNIGVESKKGTPQHRQAYERLQALMPKLNFVGNLEGREVFEGRADVLVTDGFTGNVFLKTAEGVSSYILAAMRDAFLEERNSRGLQALKALTQGVDYNEYPGAIVCGVDALVIKCHGSASSRALAKAILSAADLLDRQWLAHMRRSLV